MNYLRYNTIIGIYTRQVRTHNPLYFIDRVIVFEKNTRRGIMIINDVIALKRTSGRRNHTTRPIRRVTSIKIVVIHLRNCGLLALLYAPVFLTLIHAQIQNM